LNALADDKKPDDKKPDAGTGIVVVDAKGKENKIKSWQIVAGTQRLGWLAPAEAPDKEVKPKDKDADAPPRRPVRPTARGPEALAFRDDNSTSYAKGVMTYIPLEHLRSVEFDGETQTATVRVATSDKPGDDVILTGTTKYAGVNKLTIEAEVDKGDLGIAAIKYTGGVKNGIKAVRFPSPKPYKAPAGRTASVTVDLEKKDTTPEKVTGLQVLYLTTGGEIVSPILMFKKTIKLDVAKLKKLAVTNLKERELTLSLKDGNEETLTLMDSGELNDKAVKLEGLLAHSPAGWKLYPLHTITAVEFGETK
jgi:hypothetical protein